LPYRERVDTTAGTGELVLLRTYTDPVEAQIARGRLDAEGISAHVFDEGLHNVIATAAIKGVRLHVPQGDVARAEEILRERPWEGDRDDGEGAGVVRCPRCELAYCFHERMNIEGNSGAIALSFFAAIFMSLAPKRWHCHRCGHVWDDPKEGPAEMTKLGADDPRPVFRLRRSHAGMGLFLGIMGGFAASAVAAAAAKSAGPWLGIVGLVALAGVPLVGWLVGRAWTYDLCSDPACRTPLAPDREGCPRCEGQIAGVIRAADQHFAASADFRRELAALGAKDAAPRKKKTKKAAARS
jgi:Putative prokaryotic signal transducing protein